MSRLEGKVAVITGAGSGIGMATSRLFLEMGCKVICSDISDQFLSELENEISSYTLTTENENETFGKGLL